jgi:cyclopropane-fatty-acyl-phospholipid synthase
MLDRRMIYSRGFWRDARDLDEAQEHKLELIARKLKLEPGMRVLDIGCGWGGTARYLAERHDVSVVGVTISGRQVEFARERIGQLPVAIRLQDYRGLDERFDRIVSVGMIEHVGHHNHGTFMRVARRCLAPAGLMLLHTIGANHSSHRGDPWIDRYIFPDGVLPSMSQLAGAAAHRFVLEDWHGFGPDYDRTAMAWHHNVVTRWSELAASDERAVRGAHA